VNTLYIDKDPSLECTTSTQYKWTQNQPDRVGRLLKFYMFEGPLQYFAFPTTTLTTVSVKND